MIEVLRIKVYNLKEFVVIKSYLKGGFYGRRRVETRTSQRLQAIAIRIHLYALSPQ